MSVKVASNNIFVLLTTVGVTVDSATANKLVNDLIREVEKEGVK